MVLSGVGLISSSEKVLKYIRMGKEVLEDVLAWILWYGEGIDDRNRVT